MKGMLASMSFTIALIVSSPLAVAGQPDVEVIDGLIAHIYKSLAQRNGFNVLSAPGKEAARIGNVYYVTDPACAADFTRFAREGEPVRMFLAFELPNPERYRAKEISSWNSVLLSEVAGKNLGANLGGAAPEWKAQMSTALTALEQTNAQILFATRQYGSLQISRDMKNELAAQGVNSPADLGNDAVGIVAPHMELVVQKFEFDRKAIRARNANVLIRFMEMFGARISAGQAVHDATKFRQATYSTAAFKPVVAMFDSSLCSKY